MLDVNSKGVDHKLKEDLAEHREHHHGHASHGCLGIGAIPKVDDKTVLEKSHKHDPARDDRDELDVCRVVCVSLELLAVLTLAQPTYTCPWQSSQPKPFFGGRALRPSAHVDRRTRQRTCRARPDSTAKVPPRARQRRLPMLACGNRE